MRRGSCAYFGGGPKLECYGTAHTIRSSRSEKYPILNAVGKKPKRFYDQYTDSLDRMTMVGGNDNKSVFVAFNTLSSSPITSVSRYCTAQRKSVKVDQSNLLIIATRIWLK